MDREGIIKIVGRWSYWKWIFANKVLNKKVCIGISLSCYRGLWIREYIDYDGNFKRVTFR